MLRRHPNHPQATNLLKEMSASFPSNTAGHATRQHGTDFYSSSNTCAVRNEQGFEVFSVKNEAVELAAVPDLGAKIISLKNRRSGRQWLWHPESGLRLFRNQADDNFSKSPLVGIDECLPTITPCSWQKRTLPDHGEVWSQAWEVDRPAWKKGILKTFTRLRISPLGFCRTIQLEGNEVRLGYELRNFGPAPEYFVWAIHPLLRLQPGDRLELPTSTRALLNGQAWVDAIDSAIPPKDCAKSNATPVREGWAAICNRLTGDRLEFNWNPAENNTLGLWLTRGGWHGHHHFAVEPTNSADETLVKAARERHCGAIPASSLISWQIRMKIS